MKIIKQEVHFDVSPRDVYEAYVDARKHAEFTGSEVKFEARRGGKFSVWGGGLSGENVKLIPGKKIIQKWRADDWPEGHFSDLTLDLFADGDGTRLKLKQLNVPDDKFEDISSGWHQYYWEPMKEFFKK